MRYFAIILLVILSITISKGQTAIGEWRDYLSFYNVHSVEKVGNRIYAATDVGLIYYDTNENVVQKLTKFNGLSDVEITAIGAIPDTKNLIVGYKNGNIDIVSEETIVNIPDLYLKELTVDKNINHFSFNDNKAYCSTNFGIVVINYLKFEISDSYFIGDNASNLVIHETAFHNDYIYAATKNGILAAPINSNALSYFKTWKLVSNSAEYLSVLASNDRLIASRKSGSSADILSYKENNWISYYRQPNFVKIEKFADDRIGVVSKSSIILFTSEMEELDTIKQYNNKAIDMPPVFSSILIDENNEKWVGDNSNGLIQLSSMNDLQVVPDGPSSNQAFKLATSENSLWVVAGITHQPVYDVKFLKAELSIFRNNKWINHNSDNNTLLLKARNLNDIAIDPRNDLHGYISSAHTGIFEVRNDSIVTHYSDKNSPMDLAHIWRDFNGVFVDEEGNLFANNIGDSIPILVKPDIILDSTKENDYGWYRYNYASFGSQSDPWLSQTIKTTWGHFWSISYHNPSGLFIYDVNETIHTDLDDNYRYAGDANNSGNDKLLIWDEDGKTLNLTPKCLIEDKNGYIWVGTDDGIVVYYRPREIFNIDKPIASRIKIPRNDGSGLADFLLDKEEITSMAVDGANRKWIGTKSNGIYLVSSDGTNTIKEFKSSNSPLLTNTITSIAINPKSGEVFIGTDKGIVSYRGSATEGEVSFSNVKAFPNPVKPNYDGVITVTGLIENSNIRITDISGKVVYQASSTGGQLVWNGKNVYNEKVSSGVYLVFATDENGSESMVTKIMVIR